MRRRAGRLAIIVIGLVAAGTYFGLRARPSTVTLTGLVTTDDVIVAAQLGGEVAQLLVAPGDRVSKGQLLAVIRADEQRADRAYYGSVVEEAASGVRANQAALRQQQRLVTAGLEQARASLAAAEASRVAAAAELEQTRLVRQRTEQLQRTGLASAEALDQARTTFDAAQARVESLERQVEAARAAVAVAQANAEQTAVRESQLEASRSTSAAAGAQRDKASVRLAYAEVRAPLDGVVDVRAARQGEIVSAAQPIVTLVDPDDLWVRVDVEETYIEGVRLGDRLTVRLPSGDVREGTVVLRRVDGGFATQRDVSRTKRDIRAFEVRLRVPNTDRRLAVGMTAWVDLPVTQ